MRKQTLKLTYILTLNAFILINLFISYSSHLRMQIIEKQLEIILETFERVEDPILFIYIIKGALLLLPLALLGFVGSKILYGVVQSSLQIFNEYSLVISKILRGLSSSEGTQIVENLISDPVGNVLKICADKTVHLKPVNGTYYLLRDFEKLLPRVIEMQPETVQIVSTVLELSQG